LIQELEKSCGTIKKRTSISSKRINYKLLKLTKHF